MRLPALVLATVLTVMAGTAVTGCSGGGTDGYCDHVKSDQAKLGQVLGGDANSALIEALPLFQGLRDDAPDDIRPDWTTLVDAVQGLQDALDDAGVDPSTYDRKDPPAGVTAKQKAAIDAAARQLSDPATVAAFNAVQQQARDVCRTPLTV